MSNTFSNRFGNTITNDFDITIYFPYRGTTIRDAIDRKSGDFDLQINGDPDMIEGFYKGRKGNAQAIVRTSSLTSAEIARIQQDLLSEFKSMVIN
jgi:hypothetical protein